MKRVKLIKQVQDSARSDVMDFDGMPINRAQNTASRTQDIEGEISPAI